ncbi:hypothetical protein [Nocardioides bizhenqiangii]|uniref:ABC transporter permease n=1 Tax=Nocardioides bizhenqiangii TaxID=3095076 RepID=A0ABZ0ZPX0_9ACTN|nr:hypothetical protein [Nocardioides sp. HM61]WQQ26390.1 hypothetical protein SHK19_20845 [Nocardioides sp. HM61]
MRMRSEWLGSPLVRLGLLVALLAAGLVPVMSRGGQWLGSWKLALDWGTSSVILLGPVAAGIACGVYARIHRAGLADLLGQAVRPWRGWVTPALAVWGLAGTALLLLCGFTTTAAWLAGATAYPHLWWVVLPALLVLGAQVALGGLVGGLTGRYWAVPWVAVGTFVLFILTSIGVIPVVFDTGGATGTLAGQTYSPPWFAFQSVVAVGVAATAMTVSNRELFRVSPLPWKLGTGAAAGAAALTLVFVDAPLERYEPVRSIGYECRDGRPRVCMTEDARRPLDDLATKMQRLAGALEAAGAHLPDRFVHARPGSTPAQDAGVLRLFVDEVLAERVGYPAAAESLTTPAPCAAYSSDDPRDLPETWFAVNATLVRWLLVQEGEESVPSGDHPMADWWALPVEQQYAWVRATYSALRDCRLRDLRLPR